MTAPSSGATVAPVRRQGCGRDDSFATFPADVQALVRRPRTEDVFALADDEDVRVRDAGVGECVVEEVQDRVGQPERDVADARVGAAAVGGQVGDDHAVIAP
jgi:hypothetical protein